MSTMTARWHSKVLKKFALDIPHNEEILCGIAHEQFVRAHYERPKCPCVIHAESGRCIVYNSRYQAANVEEAMLAFHDLTSRHEPAPERYLEIHIDPHGSLAYLNCEGRRDVVMQNTGMPTLLWFALLSTAGPWLDRFRFPVPPVPTNTPPYVQSTIEAGLRNAGKLPQNSDSNQQLGPQPGELNGQQYVEGRFTYQESRRQAQWQSPRGSNSNSYPSSSFVPSQTGFGGYGRWGECQQQFRNVEVLRRVGGQWQTAALSVATCCDCRVRAGTEIHALVVGDKK
ncbi:hypothetical protein TELCIR_02188 [Teladorsagia circumcincta]|uniref:Uncharacterized protein n=1 Tax=Teladorsagia circumcincta TaxID=45464 RepID=A0A2G9V031_TELCI|nr:hypothetical protein TELCIR_02188 [Teladorsagia circumcincta]